MNLIKTIFLNNYKSQIHATCVSSNSTRVIVCLIFLENNAKHLGLGYSIVGDRYKGKKKEKKDVE